MTYFYWLVVGKLQGFQLCVRCSWRFGEGKGRERRKRSQVTALGGFQREKLM